MAKLYFIYAPMGSGKSTMLLTKAHSFEERKIPFICLKPAIDDRDGIGTIKSRIGIQRECVSIDNDDDIFEILNNYINLCNLQLMPIPQWVLIDESQFLTKIQVEQVARIVDEHNINVVCYGLRTDFTSNLFEGSKRLMELADTIEEMKTTCSCGKKAIINARFHNGELLINGNQILIGGDELYMPLCRDCFNKLRQKSTEYGKTSN